MKFTKEWEKKISDRKGAFRIKLKDILANKASIKAKCDGAGNQIEISGDGSRITQMWMAAALAANVINMFEGDEGEIYILFLAALEMQREKMKDFGPFGNFDMEV